ncbi:MAG: hypothetical protein A2017_03975 [Lentisphaerae bacterium GWF2_44_16]|nr:MAG: hypothetical protein A2017_03975 [Lentisphaerae bacterium GWF2_44_16]
MWKILSAALFSVPFFISGAEIIIDKNTVWKGTVEIKDKVSVRQRALLKVLPGAEIIFSAKGQLLCEGKFSAEKALFKADVPASGFSRMEFSGSLTVKNCTFKGMITEKKRYHNAFLTADGDVDIASCTFENSSAVECVRTKEAVIKNSFFIEPVDIGLALFHSNLAEVAGNSFRGGERTSNMLKLNSVEKCRIKQNRFFGKGVGTELYGKSVKNIICMNSYFDNTNGMTIHNGSSENLIFSCLFDGSSYCGMRVLGGEKNLVRNCVFWNCAKYGILLSKFKESKIPSASIKITNTAISSCGTGILCGDDCYSGEITYGAFWKNAKDTDGKTAKFKIEKNIQSDPLFVAPQESNFRPRMKNFGYEADSPLLNAGYPEGSSIGLFISLKAK